jgi:hypothetical protein
MTQDSSKADDQSFEIDLREPKLAALLAWLWPGAGHIYQRRYGKGILFMVCILGTYIFGLAMGGGHVVYASWKPNHKRWQYFCQLGVGTPAMPAIVQSMRVRSGKAPFFTEGYYEQIGNQGPPGTIEPLESLEGVDLNSDNIYVEAPMAPPGKVTPSKYDLLAKWHEDHHSFFELGTLFTVIAGLLNVLVIYDAYAGPIVAMADPKHDKAKKSVEQKESQK